MSNAISLSIIFKIKFVIQETQQSAVKMIKYINYTGFLYYMLYFILHININFVETIYWLQKYSNILHIIIISI